MVRRWEVPAGCRGWYHLKMPEGDLAVTRGCAPPRLRPDDTHCTSLYLLDTERRLYAMTYYTPSDRIVGSPESAQKLAGFRARIKGVRGLPADIRRGLDDLFRHADGSSPEKKDAPDRHISYRR